MMVACLYNAHTVHHDDWAQHILGIESLIVVMHQSKGDRLFYPIGLSKTYIDWVMHYLLLCVVGPLFVVASDYFSIKDWGGLSPF